MIFAALALVVACGGESTGESGSNPTPPTGSLLLGADVSALERIEQGGGVFRDAGVPGDALAILRAHGSNAFRLRLFVNPNGDEVQVNDLAYTIRLAARVKAAGAKLLLDIHYSDTWADPGHQEIPTIWTGLEFDTLERRVETYTDSVVTALKQAQALPDIVQVGNEIDGGILWPEGQVTGAGFDTPAQWDRFARLLKAGIRGVRGALSPDDTVRVMLHYSQGASAAGTQWFFDQMAAHNVPYDIIGLSYYPWWHGTLAELRTSLNATAARFQRKVYIVETAYPWRAGGWEGMVVNAGAMTWPVTPSGQAGFLNDIVNAMLAVPGGRGGGVYWWYPESIQVPGLFAWGGGSLALFQPNGDVLPAALAFENR